jgi:hypothetical protein
MRMRIVAVVAGAALVLPVAALAQEDDLCHFDPTNPECIEGRGRRGR